MASCCLQWFSASQAVPANERNLDTRVRTLNARSPRPSCSSRHSRESEFSHVRTEPCHHTERHVEHARLCKLQHANTDSLLYEPIDLGHAAENRHDHFFHGSSLALFQAHREKEQRSQGKISTGAALFCACSALMGPAPQHPFGFSQVGPVLGVTMMALAVLVVGAGVYMSVQATQSPVVGRRAKEERVSDRQRCDASYVAFAAFGGSALWRVATSLILSLDIWSALVLNLANASIVGSMLSGDRLSRSTVIVLVELVTLPMLGAPPWLFAISCKLALTGLALCITSFVYTVVTSDSAPQPLPDELALNTATKAFGIFLFSFGNAPCLQCIRNNMRDQSKFPLVAAGGVLIAGCYYAVLGSVGALTFGSRVKQSYLRNIDNDILRTITCAALVARVPLMSPMMTNPILSSMMPLAGITSERAILLFKIGLLTATGLSAIALSDYVAGATAVVGRIMTTTTCVFLPALLFHQLGLSDTLGKRFLLMAACFPAMSFAIGGTYMDMV